MAVDIQACRFPASTMAVDDSGIASPRSRSAEPRPLILLAPELLTDSNAIIDCRCEVPCEILVIMGAKVAFRFSFETEKE